MTHTFSTIIVVILGLVFGHMLAIAILEASEPKPLEGDMNHDNQLTIVDLSILAERIRTQ